MNADAAAPILVVDDEQPFLQSASFALRSAGFPGVTTCGDSRQALDLLRQGRHGLVLLDVLMPHLTGRDLLPKIVEEFPGLPVIMLTALNEVDTAVTCIKAGAFDYLLKPVDKMRLVTSVRKALEFEDLAGENSRLRERMLATGTRQPQAFAAIVTRSPAMQAIFRYIEAIAPTALPVLITGETGTGKELVARALHAASGRTGEFTAVNVGGLDDTLFSDTLFGHEKGAFTGADRERGGLIRKAAGGTLFLDEIGELRPESQIKLLRLLEDRTYYPHGSDAPQNSDARIVCATNAEIDPSTPGSAFRKDLYYRLQNHRIRMIPLRERREDLEPLLVHFLALAAAELGVKTPAWPPELLHLLNGYHFPGNVRELRGMVFDALSRHGGGVLSTEVFRQYVQAGREKSPMSGSETGAAAPGERLLFTTVLPTIMEAEELLVAEAMRRASDNQSVAAQMLGITRSALNKRLNHPREKE